MTRNQKRFAAALQQVGYTATKAAGLAAPARKVAAPTPEAKAPTRRARVARPASYAAGAHPWAHDEE